MILNKIKLLRDSPLLKNILVYALSDGLTKALPFIVFPIVAYYLSVEDYGKVNNFQVLLGIITPFIGLSTNSFFLVDYYKDTSNSKNNYNQIIYFNVLLFFLVSLVSMLFVNTISNWSQIPVNWIPLVLLTGFFVPFQNVFLAKLRIQEKAKSFGFYNFLNVLITTIFTILLVVVLKKGWEGRVLSIVISNVIFGIISIYFSIKYIGKFRKLDIKVFKLLLLFGLPLLPHTIALWGKTAFVKIYITDTLGILENGLYSFAVSISAIFFLFSSAFFSAFSPYVYKKLSTDNLTRELKEDIVKKVYYFLFFYLIVMILGFFALTFLINHFYFEKYGKVVGLLPYLLGYNFFNALYIALSIFIYYKKKTKLLGILTIITAILNVLLLLVFVPVYGLYGAVITNLIVSVFTFVLVYYFTNKVYPMPWNCIFKFKRN